MPSRYISSKERIYAFFRENEGRFTYSTSLIGVVNACAKDTFISVKNVGNAIKELFDCDNLVVIGRKIYTYEKAATMEDKKAEKQAETEANAILGTQTPEDQGGEREATP
jgi:hypothetical protein